MFRTIPFAALIALSACNMTQEVDGSELFAANCSGCHGTDGKGNAEMEVALGRDIPDLTQIAARNGGTFDHDAVMSQIDGLHRKEGSPMPEFGEADLGPIVMVGSTPIPAELLALSGYLESIQE